MIDLQPYIKVKVFDIEDELYKKKRYRRLMLWWAGGLGAALTAFAAGILMITCGG